MGERKKTKPAGLDGCGGIHFIDPEDAEFRDTTKNARENLEIPIEPAMLCMMKLSKYGETRRLVDDCCSKSACTAEANESRRMRLEGTLP